MRGEAGPDPLTLRTSSMDRSEGDSVPAKSSVEGFEKANLRRKLLSKIKPAERQAFFQNNLHIIAQDISVATPNSNLVRDRGFPPQTRHFQLRNSVFRIETAGSRTTRGGCSGGVGGGFRALTPCRPKPPPPHPSEFSSDRAAEFDGSSSRAAANSRWGVGGKGCERDGPGANAPSPRLPKSRTHAIHRVTSTRRK